MSRSAAGKKPPPLVVGSESDPHVTAVVAECSRRPVVLDVDELTRSPYSVSLSTVSVTVRGNELRLGPSEPGRRGWIRRLSPLDWEHNVTIGSLESARKASWLSLAAHIARSPDVEWLTDLDRSHGVESKLRQYSAASRLGIACPDTLVSNIAVEVDRIQGSWIAKPLGPSHFEVDGELRVLYALDVDRDPSAIASMAGSSPFLLQERVAAKTHLRIVTMGTAAWVCALDANGLDTDWRRDQEEGHDWVVVDNDVATSGAKRLASTLGVGYSSQDWIVGVDDRLVFLDLNPVGQWMFLPTVVVEEITESMARWLCA